MADLKSGVLADPEEMGIRVETAFAYCRLNSGSK
jgi:hypothetical protein